MKKIGNWTYKKSNLTLNFKTKDYTYEVDLERLTPKEWIEHLYSTKRRDLISEKDLYDLRKMYEELNLI